jgi:hypothetical protein
MRLRSVGAAVLVTLVVSAAGGPAAVAKGPAEVTLCGRTGCVALEHHVAWAPITSWWWTPFTERPAPRSAPFFRFVARQAAPDALGPVKWTLLYVPQRHAMRITQSRVPPYSTGVGPYWRTIPLSARAALLQATDGVKPYRAPTRWPR